MENNLLPLVVYPDPKLQTECAVITDYEPLEHIAGKMYELMKTAEGVGLAGNQIGLLHRIFVYEHENKKGIIINPQILKHEGQAASYEGCLSFPYCRFKVPRASKITMQYNTITGEEKTEDFEGFIAVLFQHETDHLNGLRIIDKTTAAEKQKHKKIIKVLEYHYEKQLEKLVDKKKET